MRWDFLGKNERDRIGREVDLGARNIGSDTEYGSPPVDFDTKKFGLCCDCSELRASISKFGSIFARCYEFDKNLNSSDPIEKCSDYKKKGSMTLWDMKEIAYIIEVDKKEIGFIL